MRNLALFGLLAALLVLPTGVSGGQATAQASPSAASPSAADQLVRRVQARYAEIRTLRGQFEQSVGGQTISGTLTLRGDAYRIELPGQTLVSDGATAWSYTPADEVVLVSTAADDAQSIQPGRFFTEFPERFTARRLAPTTVGGVRMERLGLTPVSPDDAVATATLFVRASDLVPVRLEATAAGGGQITLALRDVEINPSVGAGTFRFTPPAGAEVVDLR
jgi:outer membrane lipoprotein-sorting protein